MNTDDFTSTTDRPAARGPSRRELLERTVMAIPATRVRNEKPSRALTTDREEAIADANETRGLAAQYMQVKGRLHQRLLSDLDMRNRLGSLKEHMDVVIREFVDNVLATEALPLNVHELNRLFEDLLEETLGV